MTSDEITILKRGLNLFGISNAKVAKESSVSATYVGNVLNQTINTDSEKTRKVLECAKELLSAAKAAFEQLERVA